MGEKQRKPHFCRECVLNPCNLALYFRVAQPTRCPDFKPCPEVEKSWNVKEPGFAKES